VHVGTAADVVAALSAIADLGATVILDRGSGSWAEVLETMERFAADVRPRLEKK
jgi:hypothetical protein